MVYSLGFLDSADGNLFQDLDTVLDGPGLGLLGSESTPQIFKLLSRPLGLILSVAGCLLAAVKIRRSLGLDGVGD